MCMCVRARRSLCRVCMSLSDVHMRYDVWVARGREGREVYHHYQDSDRSPGGLGPTRYPPSGGTVKVEVYPPDAR